MVVALSTVAAEQRRIFSHPLVRDEERHVLTDSSERSSNRRRKDVYWPERFPRGSRLCQHPICPRPPPPYRMGYPGPQVRESP